MFYTNPVGLKRAMAKAISGRSATKGRMAMATAAIPMTPPMFDTNYVWAYRPIQDCLVQHINEFAK